MKEVFLKPFSTKITGRAYALKEATSPAGSAFTPLPVKEDVDEPSFLFYRAPFIITGPYYAIGARSAAFTMTIHD